MNTSTVVLGKELERDFSSSFPGLVEFGRVVLDSLEVGQGAPLPACVYVGGQDAIPGLGQGGVLVANESVEGGAGCFEHGESRDGAGDVNAVLAADTGLDVARLAGILDEAVGMRLPVDIHPVPSVGDDVDVGHMDVAVLLDKVIAQDRGKPLRWIDGMLLGGDEDGVLNGVGGHHDTVVGVGIGSLNVTFEEAADGHLGDILKVGCLVTVDFEKTDIVLSIAGRGHIRHDWASSLGCSLCVFEKGKMNQTWDLRT